MTRVRWRLTALAALATVLALQPITGLFTSDEWFRDAVGIVVVTALTGLGLRALVRSRLVVVLVQVVVTSYVILLRFAADTFSQFLPTLETIELANTYGLTALETIQKHSAPAPLNTGVTFCLVVAAGLVAVVVDAAAATWRAPAAAGLPLLAAYLITAANGSDALPATAFLAPVALWLLMLHLTARRRLDRWGTTSASTPGRQDGRENDRTALWSLSAGAARFGGLAVLLALVVPAVVPHFAPRYLADGLGRSGGSEGVGTVGFNDTIDLRRSLQNTDETPLIQYSTTGSGNTPLRALATSNYARGEWSRGPDRGAGPKAPFPPPASANRSDSVMTVTVNALAAPELPAPYPVLGVATDGVQWGYEPVTGDVKVAAQAGSYRVTYTEVPPDAERLRAAGEPSAPTLVADDLEIPGEVQSLVIRWANELTAGLDNDLDKAVAIQDHLRDTSIYTYDLDLGAPLRDAAGRQLDPISQFYETRRGYCTQFASAMIFLARAEGIPARLAIGFLPGTRQGSTYVVRASNAHAWPELYFQGVGWVRFEPTPGSRSGTPPSYAVQADGDTPGEGQQVDEDQPTSTATTPARRQDLEGENLNAQGATGAGTISGGQLVLLLAVGLGLLATFLMPVTAWLVRTRRRRAAANRQELVELEWEELTTHLEDLGLAAFPGDTLRQWRQHFLGTAHLDPEHAEAVGRVTATLERSRYDRPERTSREQAAALHRDIRAIRRRVSRSRAWQTRMRSFFWPSTGVAVWRDLTRRLGRGRSSTDESRR